MRFLIGHFSLDWQLVYRLELKLSPVTHVLHHLTWLVELLDFNEKWCLFYLLELRLVLGSLRLVLNRLAVFLMDLGILALLFLRLVLRQIRSRWGRLLILLRHWLLAIL